MKTFSQNTNISELIELSLDKVKGLMETNTIVGKPINYGNVSIIPISKVSVGFVAGGGEYSDKSSRRVSDRYPMAGTTGGGMMVQPVGFLINIDGNIRFVDVENKSTYQTTLNLINKLINKFGAKSNKTTRGEEDETVVE